VLLCWEDSEGVYSEVVVLVLLNGRSTKKGARSGVPLVVIVKRKLNLFLSCPKNLFDTFLQPLFCNCRHIRYRYSFSLPVRFNNYSRICLLTLCGGYTVSCR